MSHIHLLEQLRERLANATGPDHQIDVSLFEFVGLTPKQQAHCRDWCRMDGRTDLTRAHYVYAWAPAYTKSIDAAITLVPPGAWKETNGPRRYLNIPSPSPNYWHCELTLWESMRMYHGWGATEALAICDAALHAKEQAAVVAIAGQVRSEPKASEPVPSPDSP